MEPWSTLDSDVSVQQDRDAIDTELNALLPALELCKNGRVICLTARRNGFVSLLPFHLHVRCPDALKWLPLTATVTILPFNASVAWRPLYRFAEARGARKAARQARYGEKRNLHDDFILADWEAAKSLDRHVFAPCSFLSIERVQSDGATISVPRPKIGRHARRNAPCPRVLTPGAREFSERTAKVLAGTDLVVVDLQGLRGRRGISKVQAVLATRPIDQPTLIIAGSPSDLFAAGLEDPPKPDRFAIIGSQRQIESLDVISVGRDRLAADERFGASLRGLTGCSALIDRLVALAESAWWAARQALDPEGSARERRRFERALEDLASEDRLTADIFTACRTLLTAAASDAALQAERRRAAVRAVVETKGPGHILALTRSWKDATVLRAAVAAELGIGENDLEALGVSVRTAHAVPGNIPCRVVVVGYGGMASIDAVLASGAPRICTIFDPVETRAAWYNARRMADYLTAAGAAHAASPLRKFAESLTEYVTGFALVRDLGLDYALRDGAVDDARNKGSCADEAVVSLIDGTRIEVPLGTRFEVLGQRGMGSRVLPVTALEPGHQVVLLDDDARAVFSERRMAVLDAGVLAEQNRTRKTWLALMHAIAVAKHLTPTAIADGMAARGHRVTAAAVSHWFADKPDSAHTPLRFESFLALAETLGLGLPQESLRQYYRHIHEWRILHRRAGREVAQAIRLAYTGRLGPASLARIEREWGFGVRALIDAARVGVIDEVILPSTETT